MTNEIIGDTTTGDPQEEIGVREQLFLIFVIGDRPRFSIIFVWKRGQIYFIAIPSLINKSVSFPGNLRKLP